MELKINCDTKVSIDRLNSLKTVDCNVISFNLDKNVLNGDIRISGKYYKDDLDKFYQFEDVVPFTVMFNDENINIQGVTCGNFSCQEVVNQGIECHFDVFIRYENGVIEIPVELPSEKLEIKMEDQKKVEVEHKKIEVEVEVEEEKEVEDKDNAYEEITQKYDDLLGEILDVRNDNFLDPKRTDGLVKINQVQEKKERLALSNMFEKQTTIKIYFPSGEQEVDQICKEKQLNINDAYEEYRKNRRIIIK